MKRGEFIKKGSLTTVTILFSVTGFSAWADLSKQHHAVVSGLSGYSNRVSLAVTDHEVHIVASIDKLASFTNSEVLSVALPYGPVKADGNTLSFTHGDVQYRLENVLPQDFDTLTRNSAQFTQYTTGR